MRSPLIALLNGPVTIPSAATITVPGPARCPGLSPGSFPPVTGHIGDLVLGLTRTRNELVSSYLPASRFWTMQLIGGGLYLVITATALGTAVWLLHRRTTRS